MFLFWLINAYLISSWKRYLGEPDRGGSSAPCECLDVWELGAPVCSQPQPGCWGCGSELWQLCSNIPSLCHATLLKVFFNFALKEIPVPWQWIRKRWTPFLLLLDASSVFLLLFVNFNNPPRYLFLISSKMINSKIMANRVFSPAYTFVEHFQSAAGFLYRL